MRGNKLEKSHIHILQSETLSRESRVTESAQEIVDSIQPLVIAHSILISTFYKTVLSDLRGVIHKNWGILLGRCLTCEELSGGGQSHK